MAQEIKTQWLGNMLFNADTLGGNFKIDAAPESGGEGKGVRPKALMLTSLAGCTGMDIVSLLKKMRAEVDDIEINVSGELSDEHPKIYHKVTLEYIFYGKDLKKDNDRIKTELKNVDVDEEAEAFQREKANRQY